MSPLRLQREGRIATLTIDRPPLNILDLATLEELQRTVAGLSAEGSPQALLVRGAGERAFSAGVAAQDHTRDRIPELLDRFHGALRALRQLDAVTIAVVRGHCLGGGLELALACDLVLAGDGARLGQPEIDLGCFPPFAAALYPRRIGSDRTLALLATGRTLAAAEAERWGLVTWVVPDDELEVRAAALAEELAGKSAVVTRLLKRAVRAGTELGFADALAETERLYLEDLTATEDLDEGLRAFLEKRKPVWRHR